MALGGHAPVSVFILTLAIAASSSACGTRIVRQYEYEEDLFLALDGAATLYVNASVPALVALRGLPLDPDPRALVDRAFFRRAYAGPGIQVTRVTFSRRRGRRFVHLRLDADDVRKLPSVEPLSWSEYRFDQQEDAVLYRQQVGLSTGRALEDVGWRGDEVTGFRLHVPSRILFENTPGGIERGNILVWEQSLRDRQASAPLTIEARMERTSILSRTLLLFAASGAAALLVMAGLIAWTIKRGRSTHG